MRDGRSGSRYGALGRARGRSAGRKWLQYAVKYDQWPDELISALGWVDERFEPDLLLMEMAQGGTPFAETAKSLEQFAKRAASAFAE